MITKKQAARIRELAAQGYTEKEIAKLQHYDMREVRDILTTPERPVFHENPTEYGPDFTEPTFDL